jgi:serine/threonine protein kinase
MGMIFYQMLFGRTPWNGRTPYELLNNINNQKLVFLKSINLKNPLILDLLKRMLEREESDRISWEDIFCHALFKKVDVEETLKKSVCLANKEDEKLSKSRALNEIYVEQNRVVKNPYECAKRSSYNRCLIQEENPTPTKENAEKQEEKDISLLTRCSEKPEEQFEGDYEALLEEQKRKREEKKSLQMISDWVKKEKEINFCHLCLNFTRFSTVETKEFS